MSGVNPHELPPVFDVQIVQKGVVFNRATERLGSLDRFDASVDNCVVVWTVVRLGLEYL